MINWLVPFLIAPLIVGSVTIQSYICQPPAVPVITAPSDGSSATTNQAVVVSGDSTADTTVSILVDGSVAATTLADQNNYFAGAVNLTAGTHQLTIKAVNPCGSADGTQVVSVTAVAPVITIPDPEVIPVIETTPLPEEEEEPVITTTAAINRSQPTFVITSPADGYSTTDLSVFLSGRASSPAIYSVTVNGAVVASTSSAQRDFGFQIPLNVSENKITVHALISGVEIERTITVMRVDPPPEQSGVTWLLETPRGRAAIFAAGTGLLIVVIILILIGR